MAGLFSRLLGRQPAPTPAAPAARLPPRPAVPLDLAEGLVERLTTDHRACDEEWGLVEGAAGDPEALAAAFALFDAHIRLHLLMEEEVLFPEIERATGMSGMGPTAIMRSEHTQMRGVLNAMKQALADGDVDELLDQGDTLLMITQQHNAKEEGVLYPMAAQVLPAGRLEENVEKLASMQPA